MPATIAELRTGLADALSAIAGFRVYQDIPDTPSTPCAVLELRRVSYDTVMARGADEYQFTVTMLSGRADDRTAQARVEAAVAGSGPQSIKAALEADPTLGGAAMTTRVMEAGGLQSFDRNDGLQLLGVEFQVSIYA